VSRRVLYPRERPPVHRLAVFLLSLIAFHARLLAAERQPNVIVILADDLGYGDLSCYGHKTFKTPRLDRMASEGIRLTQFNTPMPFCAPTRASLLTGRYPWRCGMNGNPAPDGGANADQISLPIAEVLLPQLLKGAGYATGMVGKWHLGHKRLETYPTRRGFDDYLGILYSNDMRPVQLIDGEKAIEYPLVQAKLTERYTERALFFIEQHKSRPFFLYFAHAMPHKPLATSEKFYKKSGAGLYGDVLAELDDSVGQVLDKLRDLKLEEQTLVIFTSDNGPWFGGSSGGLRGMKSTSWEGGYRVPLIARWPSQIAAGKVNHSPTVMMDLFATTLAATNVPAPADRTIDGRNLLPHWAGSTPAPHDVIFGQHGEQLATVRDARWKLHLIAARENVPRPAATKWIDPRGPDGVTILAPYEQSTPADYPGISTGEAAVALMLFDLEHDPAEQHNVAADHPEIVARLRQAAEDMQAERVHLRSAK